MIGKEDYPRSGRYFDLDKNKSELYGLQHFFCTAYPELDSAMALGLASCHTFKVYCAHLRHIICENTL